MRFKTIREEVVGKVRLRLLSTDGEYVGMIIARDGTSSKLHGADPIHLWAQLRNEVGKSNPNFVGYDGARANFLRKFPGGFEESVYLTQERNPKLAAKRLLDDVLPLSADVRVDVHKCQEVSRVFQATNLLHVQEKIRVREVLESPAGPAFVEACRAFSIGDQRAALADLQRILGPFQCAKWTVVTYLAFLWRPDAHMFLKPDISKEFADRVGHPFSSDYSTRLDPSVYESLQDLIAKTSESIADLSPADNIDVQSYVWVVGRYKDPGKA